MTKTWKVIVILSLTLNGASLVAVFYLAQQALDAQIANVNLFMQLSKDQQKLRREVGAYHGD